MTKLWLLMALLTLVAGGAVFFPLLKHKVSRVWPWAVIVWMLPLLSISLYIYWGSSQQLKDYYLTEKHTQSFSKIERQLQEDPGQVIHLLKKKVDEEPSNPQGWYLLGKLYFAMRQLQPAEEAFSQAYHLAPENREYAVHYAQILFFIDEGLEQQAQSLVNAVLQKEPNHPAAINLLALDAVRHKNYSAADKYWRQLLTILPKESEDYSAVQAALANLSAYSSEIAKPQKQSHSIRVQVKLAEQFKSQVRPTDTVFIYARAATGPKMPLAIIRKQVKDLPLTVTLDDSVAMTPQLALSKFSEIIVFARISKSGQAMTQPGDLIGTSGKIVVSSTPSLTVLINEEV